MPFQGFPELHSDVWSSTTFGISMIVKFVRLAVCQSRRRVCSWRSQCWSATSHACLRSGLISEKTRYQFWSFSSGRILTQFGSFISQALITLFVFQPQTLILILTSGLQVTKLAQIVAHSLKLMYFSAKVDPFMDKNNCWPQRDHEISSAFSSGLKWLWMRKGWCCEWQLHSSDWRCKLIMFLWSLCLNEGLQMTQMEIARKDNQIRELHDEYALLSAALNLSLEGSEVCPWMECLCLFERLAPLAPSIQDQL